MPNSVNFHHDGRIVKQLKGITECPTFCNYSINGLPWDVATHRDYIFSIQQMFFLGNNMRLIEFESKSDSFIRFSVEEPTVFVVIMIAGFVKFQQNDTLVSYAMGGVFYMCYNPSTDFILESNPGKHAMMVISLNRDWFITTERAYPQLRELVAGVRENIQSALILPMCRLTQPIMEIWKSMRVISVEPFRHRSNLTQSLVELLTFYDKELERGNFLKGQLSVDIANLMFQYIQKNYTDSDLSIDSVAKYLKVSNWKVREYSDLLFGKSIHKYVRQLRMTEVIRLLKTTNLSVGDIALCVGYVNLPNFYEMFLKYFGVSPSSYRESDAK